MVLAAHFEQKLDQKTTFCWFSRFAKVNPVSTLNQPWKGHVVSLPGQSLQFWTMSKLLLNKTELLLIIRLPCQSQPWNQAKSTLRPSQINDHQQINPEQGRPRVGLSVVEDLRLENVRTFFGWFLRFFCPRAVHCIFWPSRTVNYIFQS